MVKWCYGLSENIFPRNVTARETWKNDLRMSKSTSRDLRWFWPLKTPLNGLVTQKTHTSCIPSRHIPGKYVLRKTVTPFYHISIFDRSLVFWSPKCTRVSCVKNTLFKQSTWTYRTLDHRIFNVIFILKHPGVSFTSSYRDIHTLRTHP